MGSPDLNPYAAPEAALPAPDDRQLRKGLSRTGLVSSVAIASVATLALIYLAVRFGEHDSTAELPPFFWIMMGTIVLLFGSLMALIGARLRNIGWHWGWCFLALMPFVNFLVLVTALSLPAGFARSRRMDNAGWLLAGAGCTTGLILLMVWLGKLAAR